MEVDGSNDSLQRKLPCDENDTNMDEMIDENNDAYQSEDGDDNDMDNGDEEEYEYEYESEGENGPPIVSNYKKGNIFRYNFVDIDPNDTILTHIFRVMKDVTTRLKYACECNWEYSVVGEQQNPILSITGPLYQHDLLFDFSESFIDENSTMLDKPVRIYPLFKMNRSDIYYTCCKHPALFRENWNPFVDLVHVTVSIVDSIEAARSADIGREEDGYMLLNDPESAACIVRELYYDYEVCYRHYQPGALLSLADLLPSIRHMRVLPTDTGTYPTAISNKRRGVGYSDRSDEKKGTCSSVVWSGALAAVYAQKRVPVEKLFSQLVSGQVKPAQSHESSTSSGAASTATSVESTSIDKLSTGDIKWLFRSPLIDIFESWLVECSKEEYYRHQGFYDMMILTLLQLFSVVCPDVTVLRSAVVDSASSGKAPALVEDADILVQFIDIVVRHTHFFLSDHIDELFPAAAIDSSQSEWRVALIQGESLLSQPLKTKESKQATSQTTSNPISTGTSAASASSGSVKTGWAIAAQTTATQVTTTAALSSSNISSTSSTAAPATTTATTAAVSESVKIPLSLYDYIQTVAAALTTRNATAAKTNLSEDHSSNRVVYLDAAYEFNCFRTDAACRNKGQNKKWLRELRCIAENLPPEVTLYVSEENCNFPIAVLEVRNPDCPYFGGFYVFDIFIPDDYPNVNPLVKFKSTGNGSVRFNPNLYACGKVCLSLLGTWSGEAWNPGVSNLTQVLVSILFLVFVEEPYYNEPGYEPSETNMVRSRRYNADIVCNMMRWTIEDFFQDTCQYIPDEVKRKITDKISSKWQATKSQLEAKFKSIAESGNYCRALFPRAVSSFEKVHKLITSETLNLNLPQVALPVPSSSVKRLKLLPLPVAPASGTVNLTATSSSLTSAALASMHTGQHPLAGASAWQGLASTNNTIDLAALTGASFYQFDDAEYYVDGFEEGTAYYFQDATAMAAVLTVNPPISSPPVAGSTEGSVGAPVTAPLPAANSDMQI